MVKSSEGGQGVAVAAPTAASLWLVMMKAYRSMQHYVELTLVEMGIGLSDFMILEALLHKGPMSMSQTGDTVLLANPSMTAAANRLQRLSLVARQCRGGDRRVRTVELTPAGRKLIQKIYTQHESDLEAVMEDISPDERTAVRAALKCMGLAAKAKTGTLQTVR
ncbi:MAG: MarR family winged helix-turn-helix transcriptional regulator [Janthinobacterium lividum]